MGYGDAGVRNVTPFAHIFEEAFASNAEPNHNGCRVRFIGESPMQDEVAGSTFLSILATRSQRTNDSRCGIALG
jgi:hypothetical protein